MSLLGLMLICMALATTISCRTPFRHAAILVTPEEQLLLPDETRAALQRLAVEGERNAVLNLSEIAFNSLFLRNMIPEKLQSQLIDRALEEATQRIDAVYANTPEGRKARSVWHDEAVKDFKGEPYERAFVFLLRGLRYYEKGDFQNARACFISGILQDTLSVEGEFNADMATFEYLIALCDLKLGERESAAEALQRARQLRPNIPEPQQNDNLLVVGFVGEGPKKTQMGEYREILLIERGRAITSRLDVCVPRLGEMPTFKPAAQTDDMGFQATTRGGRLIDQINKRKATTKAITKETGNILIGSGAALAASGDRNTAAAGAALIVVGVGAKVVAGAMKTEADIRTIRCIPGFIYLWAGKILPGNQLMAVRCCSSSGETLSERYHEVNVPYRNDPVVIFLRYP